MSRKRAGRRAQQRPERLQQPGLELDGARNILGPPQHLDVRMTANHADRAARRIEQNPVERLPVPPALRPRRVAGHDARAEAESREIVADPR